MEKKSKERKTNKQYIYIFFKMVATVVADVEGAIFVFITPHFWAGGSHNKTC